MGRRAVGGTDLVPLWALGEVQEDSPSVLYVLRFQMALL